LKFAKLTTFSDDIAKALATHKGKLDLSALYHPCSEKKWRRQPPPGKGSECESNSDPCMKAKATAWKV
jgi:hypothetical protein